MIDNIYLPLLVFAMLIELVGNGSTDSLRLDNKEGSMTDV